MDYKEITSHEIACKLIGKDPELRPDVSAYDEIDRPRILAEYMLDNIHKAMTKEKGVPPLGTTGYIAWFWLKKDPEHTSGFGFSDTHCAFVTTRAAVGSRLRFFTPAEALYFGNQFEDLHKQAILIKQ